jgi:hypothetical protein
MNRLLFVCISIMIAVTPLFAVDVKGDFTSETRAAIDGWDFLFNRETGILTFEQQVNDNLFAKASLAVGYNNNPASMTTFGTVLAPSELSLLYSVYPVEIALNEAYFMYTDFIIPRLDLTVGKQRINWGTADVLNPTDVLNPLDLSDPLNFGKKVPSVAINLMYYIPEIESSLQVVYEPYSQVARLNPMITGKMAGGIYAGISAKFPGMTIIDSPTSMTSEVAETPEASLENFVFGTKASTQIAGFDISANYVTRMNDMPYVKEVDFDATVAATVVLNSRTYKLGYYREHEIGLDFAKDWGFLLTWGEAALFLPGEQKTFIHAVVNTVPNDVYTTVISSDPYVKYTLGASQKFEGGFYFNLQYNHGFFTERGNTGPERLQDYAMLRLEYSILSDTLKFGLTGLGNVDNLAETFKASDMGSYVANNYGVAGMADVEYMPVPGLSAKIGVMLFDGKGTSTIAQMKDTDLVYIKFNWQF